MVTTGMPYNNGRQTEVIDLNNSSFSCFIPNHFPITLRAASGGLIGQTPFVCGGQTGSGYSKACFTLEEDGSWKEDKLALLNTARSDAAVGAVVIHNQLVLAGGRGDSGRLTTMELVSPNTASKTLPVELPGINYSPCVVRWDASTFMVIGGGGSEVYKETHFVNIDNNTITDGPPLINGRLYFACNEMSVNGESFIVVAGGSKSTGTTEVLSKTNVGNGWKQGM